MQKGRDSSRAVWNASRAVDAVCRPQIGKIARRLWYRAFNLLPSVTLSNLSNEDARRCVQGEWVPADVVLGLNDVKKGSVHVVKDDAAWSQALSQAEEVAPFAGVLRHGGHEQCAAHVGSKDRVGHVHPMPQTVGLADVLDPL